MSYSGIRRDTKPYSLLCPSGTKWQLANQRGPLLQLGHLAQPRFQSQPTNSSNLLYDVESVAFSTRVEVECPSIGF